MRRTCPVPHSNAECSPQRHGERRGIARLDLLAAQSGLCSAPSASLRWNPKLENVGFTFVEVLVALGLAVLLISVTASTLTTPLRAERALDYSDQGERIAASLQAELYLTGSNE